MEIIKLIVLAIGFGTASVLVYGAWRFNAEEIRTKRRRPPATAHAARLSARSA
jgi:hypothetical protein